MAGPQGSHPGRVGGEQAARGRGDGSGGNRGQGGGQGGRGGSFGGGLSGHPGRIGGEQAARASNTARAADRPSAGGRGGGTFVGGTGTTRDTMQQQDQIGANVSNAQRDFNDEGNGFLDNVGNHIASMLGFNQIDPTQPGFSGPGMPGQTGRADWGLDPAGAIGGALGTAFGVPFVGGFLADQISAALGRPMEMNLGPDVLGGSSVDPITGETSQTATHTGGSMTIHDGEDKNTFYGAPPSMAGFGGGVSRVAPSRATFTGIDPAPVDQPAGDGFTPTTPQPGEYEQPDSLQVDPGNTGLTGEQLTGLFSNFLAPTRTARGRNSGRVVA